MTISIADIGAVADGKTLNTGTIQSAIDDLARKGGGTVVIPEGEFLSGALFFKPGVNLQLEKGAVLKASDDLANFPEQRTRIEGHFEEKFNPALINAKACNALRISGEGTLDGNGRRIWDLFWKLRSESADPRNFRNLSIPRARLCLIEKSENVTIDGITFKDSQFWNLHLYRCRDLTVQNARFQVPDDYKQAPSSDGIDVDSCQDIKIAGCYFSVTDDCIAMKGSKGPEALQDTDSPPVERVRISECTFKRGHAAVTLGSEATIVRGVVVENCKILGPMSVLHFKLRPDTPQHYEDIRFSNLTVDSDSGTLISIKPWTQYFDLKGHAPPMSRVRGITFGNVKGRYGRFGIIQGNPGQTTIEDITVNDVDVQLEDGKLQAENVGSLKFENVIVNGKPVDPQVGNGVP